MEKGGSFGFLPLLYALSLEGFFLALHP